MPRIALLVLDAALLVAFAAAGRRAHDGDGSSDGVLLVAAPFLIGYAIAALALRLDRRPSSLRRAVPVWAVGIGVGLALRGTAFDRGLAPSFVVVAFAATAVLLLGWRAVLALGLGRRQTTLRW